MAERPSRHMWRKRILSSSGPESLTRLVLLGVSMGMDRDGSTGRRAPSVRELVETTGLALSTVSDRLNRAVDEGWLERSRKGRGHPFKMRATIPESVMRGDTPTEREGVTRDDTPQEDGSVMPDVTPPGVMPDETGVYREAEHSVMPRDTQLQGREAGGSVSTTSHVSKTLPPSTTSNDGREVESGDEEEPNHDQIRSHLIEHMLSGREEALTEHGDRIGIGLLLTQWPEFVDEWGLLYETHELLALIALVRDDEEAPPKGTAFSFRWFTPPRVSRLEGRIWKAGVA